VSPTDELVQLLKKLRLSGVLLSLEIRTRQAVEDNLSHTEFLMRLLSDEVDRRGAKQLDQRIRRASFEHKKTLEEFDFYFNPDVPKAKILELANCAFVDRHENVLLFGKTGVGKSHIAQALGHRACLAGHAVLYVAATDMLRQLRAARGDGTYDRRLLRFTTPDLLLVDDLGLRPLSGEEPLDLYEIIRHRYQRGSIVITSNRDAEELPSIFGEPLLASAAMDRLLHDAHVVVMDGDTYRNPRPGRRRSTASAAGQEAT
jgi:DNA replication protein DnaC